MAETPRPGRKVKTSDEGNASAGHVKPTPKKFQKLVIQTLLQKDGKGDSLESEEEFELPQFVGTNLDLSKKRLKQFPTELLRRAEFVQYLYLEGNKLSELPPTFFQCLSHLKWLDLRNNDLSALPRAGLKNHESLEFLLLQGNRIKLLPTELGAAPNLKGLQLTGNPIVNVPYDVISSGFHSVMKHLRKLDSQEDILLPSSDAIVVRPSTVKDEAKLDIINETTGKVEENGDDVQWLPNQGQYSGEDDWVKLPQELYTPFKKWNETKKRLLKSKMCPKPKQRIISSSYHVMTKRRSRLGYKRKIITPDMVAEKSKKEMQLAKKRETLEKQARKIQRMKDKEVLKTWRRHTQRNADQLKLLDNYQQYPSRNFVTDTPFDVDPEFLNMLNRTDLYRSLKELEAQQKRRRKGVPKLQITIGELEKQMKDLRNKMENLSISDEGNTPRTRQAHLCSKIAQMREIQRALQGLQYQNVSLSGVQTSVKENTNNQKKRELHITN